MVSVQTLIQQAQTGNPQAVAALLNNKLKTKGITVKVATKNNCCSIMIEAAKN